MNSQKPKDLPLSIQSFEKLITNNLLYIDKTEQIYNLAIKPYAYFLSRPRRFGKSLMCSTLQALFEGKRELFKGLWIEKSDWKWQEHPVIHLGFNSISHETPEILEEGIRIALDLCAQGKGIVLKQNLIKEKFTELVKELSKRNGVVLIIDE